MTLGQLVLASVVMAAGATVQGGFGFGAGIVATPWFVLIDDRLVPGPINLAAFLLSFAVLVREDADVDPGVKVALAGLVPGTVLAGGALALLPARGLALMFAVLVLVGVSLTASGIRLRRNGATLVAAGALSGFMGTSSGMAAPPMALVYQDLDPPVVRKTLSRYFLIGGVLKLAMLVAVGRLGTTELVATALLVPSGVVGLLVSRRVVRAVDVRGARPWILALSAAAAVGVIAQELL